MAKGDRFKCDVCGMVCVVDEVCGCSACDLICCGKPMKNIGKKKVTKSAKATRKVAKKK